MKTIIKIPLYVEIETEEGKDRKAISNAIRSYFIPEFFSVINSKFDLIQWMSSRELRNLREVTGKGTSFRLISDTDLFVPKSSKVSDIDSWKTI